MLFSTMQMWITFELKLNAAIQYPNRRTEPYPCKTRFYPISLQSPFRWFVVVFIVYRSKKNSPPVRHCTGGFFPSRFFATLRKHFFTVRAAHLFCCYLLLYFLKLNSYEPRTTFQHPHAG